MTGVAAVQFEAVAGDVAENLRRLEPLIREAVEARAGERRARHAAGGRADA